MSQDHPDHYVTPEEFLKGIRRAFIDAYCGGKEEMMSNPWHPSDIADNIVVVTEAIKSYAEEIIMHRKNQIPGR